MNAIKEARRFIERHPDDDSARVLASLVLALESDRSFELVTLYTLDYKAFHLAIDVLREWRLDRYYAGKAKLFDLSLQVEELSRPAAEAPAPTAKAPAAKAPAPVAKEAAAKVPAPAAKDPAAKAPAAKSPAAKPPAANAPAAAPASETPVAAPAPVAAAGSATSSS